MGRRRRPKAKIDHPHSHPSRGTLWASVGMLLFGLLGTASSFGFLPICEQFVVSWLHRDEYVATQLEVDYVHETDEGADYVNGRVVADDTQLRITPIPAELYESIDPTGRNHRVLPAKRTNGRRLPIWYAPRAHGLLCDPRAEYRGLFNRLFRLSFPDLRTAFLAATLILVK